MQKLHVGSVVINVRDIEQAVTFWTAVLGLEVHHQREDWALLHDPQQNWVRIGLQLTDQPKVSINRLHLDLYSNGRQQEEVARLEKLGATRPEWDYPPDADFVVLADPDGNEFCIIE